MNSGNGNGNGNGHGNGHGEKETLPSLLLRWLRGVRRKRADEGGSVREVLEELIENREPDAPAVSTEERMLLANIFRLRDLSVADVMVPHADIVAAEDTDSLDDIAEIMTRHGHSRLPVYHETIDHVVGMIHLKDIMGARISDSPVPLAKLLRDVLFVPPSTRVLELLLEMRTSSHLAVVVDEYGGTDGLVTIEDLVEEIVGEIEDEHDQETEPQFVRRSERVYDADARVEVEVLEAISGPILDDDEREDIDTVGGIVVALAGRVPVRGELIRHPSGTEFVVMESDRRRIRKLRITLPAGSAADGED